MELDLTECETCMTDLIYIGVTVLFFVVSGLYVRFCEKLLKELMENLIVGVIALLLFAYLLVAMLRPEKF